MSKKMNVKYNGNEYTVGYTRASAAEAENAGLNINEIGQKPNVMIPLLVYYGFKSYNKGIKRGLVDEIFNDLKGNRDEFVSVLVEMYGETVNSLLSESEEGNATWTMI